MKQNIEITKFDPFMSQHVVYEHASKQKNQATW